MDSKLVFVDSCVLLDIFNDDERFYTWSSDILFDLSRTSQLVINIIVFTEIAFNFKSTEKLKNALGLLKIKILDIPVEVGFNVSRTFKQYRKNKGSKKIPMPDFYIGEHAKFLGASLVTRDTAKFNTYQPALKLICPQEFY